MGIILNESSERFDETILPSDQCFRRNNGNFIFDVALIAGMGAVIGAASGSLIANRFDENKLGRLIGGILTILGGVFLIKLFV